VWKGRRRALREIRVSVEGKERLKGIFERARRRL
jgi:hypothetical protein